MKKNSVIVAVLLLCFLVIKFPVSVMAAGSTGSAAAEVSRAGEEETGSPPAEVSGAGEEETGSAAAEISGEEYVDEFLGELDFSDLDGLLDTELFPEQQEKLSFSDVVGELVTHGTDKFDYSVVADWIRDMLFYEVNANRKLLAEAVLLAVGFSMLKNFSGTLGQAYISDICFLLVYGILSMLLLQSFTAYEDIASEALNRSVDFMKALVPTLSISMVFSSGPETSVGFYQLAFLVIYLVQWLFLTVLLPLIRIYVVMELFNHFFEDEKFQNLTELIYSIANWGMKTAVVVVLGLNAVQSLISPAKDRLMSGTAGRVAQFIPGVGNTLGGIGEMMLGAGILIKNCVGAAALVFLLIIGLSPVIKILGMSVFYKLAAAVTEPVADKRIAGCIRGMAQGGMLYFKLVVSCLALFFVTIALATAASGFMAL